MAVFLKPDNLNIVWASGGDRLYPGDTKYATGWQVEIPPRQYFNEIDHKQDQMLAHLNQHGIPVWDATTEYQANRSYVQGSTGIVYRCVLTHTNQNPDLDVSNTYWIIAFASAGDFYTAAESDARYARLSNNGSDYNITTFRTNIGVYSKAETYTKTEVDARTTVASVSQAEAGASNSVLMTPLRQQQWAQARVLGFGQTWQNLTTSRAVATQYINTTGRPIQVSVSVAGGTEVGASLFVSGVLAARSVVSGTTSGTTVFVTAIVPEGGSYELAVGDGTDVITHWAELR